MRGHARLRTVVAFALVLLVVVGWAGSSSAAVIYDGFNYPAGGLNGKDGGIGFAGPWQATKNNPTAAEPGLTWGSLSVDGNTARGAAWSGMMRPIGSALSDAGLMDNGATLWFSVIMDLTGQNTSNADINVALASDKFAGSFGDRENLNSGEGIGVTHSRAVIQGVYWQDNGDGDPVAERVEENSSLTINGVGDNLISALVVGKIEWGADATAEEKLTLYGPDTALTQGAPIMAEWAIPALDQSLFDRVSIQFKDNSMVDEIRFGASYADVAVPEPATLALLAMGGLAALRRRRK